MRTFHSYVGWWYWAVIIVSSCLLLSFFWIHQTLLTLFFATLVIFEIELLIHTQYIIYQDGTLAVQTGRFSKGIVLDCRDIVAIEKNKSLCSAPALSYNRLKITFKKGGNTGSVLVSPKNPEDFLKVLARKNPVIAEML